MNGDGSKGGKPCTEEFTAGAIQAGNVVHDTLADLMHSQRMLSTLLGNLPGLVYRCENLPTWPFLFVSEGALPLTGYTPAELLPGGGVLYGDLIHPDDRKGVWDRVQEGVNARRLFELTYRLLTKDGQEKWIWERGCGLFHADGTLEALEGFATDITASKHAEIQLRQAQRLEAVGQLASGVAHDFNNLLQVIVGNMELASNALPKDHPVLDNLQEARIACERARMLVRHLLAFSRQAAVKRQPLELNATVEAALKSIRDALGQRIDLVFAPSLAPLWIRSDRAHLEQILMHLCANGCDAMPTGGTLRIETHSAAVDEAFQKTRPWARHGNFARLTVQDEGIGMAPEMLDHIFEPFFTTKAPGRGVGLGLSMVYGIVRQQEGFLDVRSQPGKGSSFAIYLPAANDPAESEPR